MTIQEEQIKERIKKAFVYLIDNSLVKNYTTLASLMGYRNRQAFHVIMNRDKPIPQKLISKTNSLFPVISVEWLKTGKGKMICPSSLQEKKESNESKIGRFTKYLYAENIPIYQALERLNWTRRTYDKARTDDLTEEQLKDISKTFANINIEWLKKGSGTMINLEQENILVLLKRMQSEIDILKRDVAQLKTKK